MAGEYKFNQVSTPTTPAAGKGAIFQSTDKLPHFLDENASNALLQEMFIAALSADYTLTSQTAAQKIFNIPANGAITLPGSTAYLVECLLSLTTMSATSGNFLFNLLGAGTATLTSALWLAAGLDATTPGTAAALGGSATAGSTGSGDIVVAATGTAAAVLIKGIMRVNGAGTVIPSIGLTTAAAAVVKTNSYISFTPIGSNAVTTVGPWA